MPDDRIIIGDLSPGDVALLKDVAEAAAEKAVNKCLLAIGLDPNNPLKAQEDFVTMRLVGVYVRDPEFKEDLSWVRRARVNMNGAIGKAALAAIGVSVAGAAHALYVGFLLLIGGKSPP